MARQGDLFQGQRIGSQGIGGEDPLCSAAGPDPLPLLKHQLEDWQRRLAQHQQPLFNGQQGPAEQGLLFAQAQGNTDLDDPEDAAAQFNPLDLRPQALSFWRWPQAPQQGAALYFVLDQPSPPSSPLLLYVGETGRADQRWKGEHDCKSYLAAYSEALGKANLSLQLSIRFWLDVPAQVKPRRALEQALIQSWLPPFNKE
ncbi:MAG: GIY-YIG nuclease family protein, partial [Cyanobium sp. LacPavin_0920_WC12_MAG_62_9]|nr:GIY-YIG nuclease family protein [Cyanobium sp. LacPavin_0920_WC12_MAG_62_9]